MAVTVADLKVLLSADDRASDTIGKVDRSVQNVGRGMSLVGGAGLAFFTGAVGAAANFEQAMSGVQSVTNASGAEFDKLSGLAKQLGADTAFSATESARAIEELAKAGVSTADILGGAAKGATDLAAASGIGVEQAAIIASNAMNIFGLAGDQASHIADVYAAAANKSAASIEDLAMGMSQVGAVAGPLFGMSLEETTGTLALFSDYGLNGSDAGTSFKSMLLALGSPTGKQAELMGQLGLSFVKANGELMNTEEIAGQLQGALGGMTEAQRLATMETLFGSDGIRAANILYEEGASGVAEYTAAVNDEGAAARMAAVRMDNLKGSLERLQGSIETAMVIIGSAFTPAIRELADAAGMAVDLFVGMPEPIQQIVAIVGAAGSAALAAAGGWAMFGGQIKTAIATLRLIPLVLGGALLSPLGLAVVGVGALGLAFKTNFGGIADRAEFVRRRLGYFTTGVSKNFTNLRRVFTDDSWTQSAFTALGFGLRDLFGVQGEAGDELIQKFKGIGAVAEGVELGIDRIRRAFGSLSDVIKKDGLGAGLDRLFGDIGLKMLDGFGEAVGTIPQVIGRVMGSIETGIKPLDSILANVGAGLYAVGRAVELAFSGDWDVAAESLGNAVERFLTAGGTAVGVAVDVVASIGSFIIENAPDVYGAVKAKVYELFGGSADAPIVAGFAGSGHSSGTPNIPLGTVVLQIGGWVIDAADNLWEAVKTKVNEWVGGGQGDVVAGYAGSGHGTAGIPLGDFALSIGGWTIDAVTTLGGAVRDKISEWWESVPGFLGSAWDLALTIGAWSITTAVNVGSAVYDKIQEWWPGVSSFLGSAWELTVSIGSWIAKEATEGGLFTTVEEYVSGVFENKEIPLGGFTIDFGGVWDSVTTFFDEGIKLPPTVTADANRWGLEAGKAIKDLIGWGIDIAIQQLFGGGGDDQGALAAAGDQAVNASTVTLGEAVGQFFAGLLEGVLSGITTRMDEWIAGTQGWVSTNITEPIRGFFDSIWTAIGSAFSPGLNGTDAQVATGHGTTPRPGEFFTNLIKGLFEIDMPDIAFPDVAGSVSGWISGEIENIRESFDPPEWLRKLAGGDLLGAIRAFGGGSGGNEDPIGNYTPFGPGSNPAGYEPYDPTDPSSNPDDIPGVTPVEAPKFGDFGISGALGGIDVDTPVAGLMSKLGGAVAAAVGTEGGPFKGISDATIQAMADMSAQAHTGAAAFAGNLAGGLVPAVAVTGSTMAGIKGQAGTLTPNLGGAASSATGAMEGELVAGFGRATGAAGTGAAAVAGAAIGPMDGLAGEFGGAAANAGQSLVDALYGKVDAAAEAGRALADAAAGGVRGGLQIGSPSKVMTGLGENAGDSFLSPLFARLDEAKRVTTDMMDIRAAAPPAYVRSADGGGSRAGGSAALAVVNHYTYHQNVLRSEELIQLMRDAELGAQFARELPRELELA